MPIRIECPKCGKPASVPENILGRNVRCAGCRSVYQAAAAPEVVADSRAVAETLLIQPGGAVPEEDIPEAELVESPAPDERAVADTRRDQADVPSARDAAPTAALPPGAVPAAGPLGLIGRFQLQELLGQGAFGRVYRAYDPQLERPVALKVPRFPSDDAGQAERFLSEARSAARLRHPNLVAVFEAGRAGADCFIASELVEGTSLAVRLRDKPPSPKRAAQWVRDLAKALYYAHEQGIIHRDIKPANIMIGPRDRPLLMDFGLAKRIDRDTEGDAGIVGTPAYMAPELARGDPHAGGPLSDQYSLGVVLYELLTGRRPFEGPPAVLLARLLREDPPPPRRIDPDIPRDLEAICLKAMARRPHLRYHDAEELADDLQRWLRGEPTQARPVGRVGRVLRWCGRHKLPAAGIVLGVFLLGLAAYLGWVSYRRDVDARQARIDRERAKSGQVSSEAEKAQEHARSLKERGLRECTQHNLVAGLFTLAEALETMRDQNVYDPELEQDIRLGLAVHYRDLAPLRAVVLHQGVPHHLFSPDGRAFLLLGEGGCGRLLDARTGEPVGQPLRHSAAIHLAVFGPEGKALVTATPDDPLIRLWDPATGKPLGKPLEDRSGVALLRFSPDGKVLLTGNPKGLRLWDVATGKAIGAELPVPSPPTAAHFSPDGKLLVTCAAGKARLWDPATGRQQGDALDMPSGTTLTASFSPDGTTLLLADSSFTVAQVWDVAGRRRVGPLFHPPRPVTVRAVAPDGRSVLASAQDGTARLWDAATGTPLGAPYAAPVSPFLVFSPDGKTFLATESDNRAVLRTWDAATGRAVGPALTHDATVMQALFSPDGKTILGISTDNTARLWDVAAGKPIGRRLTHAASIRHAAFSPDGKRVVTAGADKTAQVWDATTARPVGEPMDHPSTVTAAAFGPDGKTVLTAADQAARLWDAATGKPTGPALAHGAVIARAAFSPDGAAVLTVSPGEVRLWQAATGKLLGAPQSEAAARALDKLWQAATGKPPAPAPAHDAPLAFSPDGKLLAVGKGKVVQRWVTATGERTDPDLDLGTAVASVTFSPDGKLLAAGDRVVRLWEGATGKPIGESMRLKGTLIRAAFGPDGRTVFLQDSAGGARLWDATRAAPAGPPWPYEQDRQARLVSPDHRTAIIHTGEGTLQLFDVLKGQPVGEPFRVKTETGYPDSEVLGRQSPAGFHATGLAFGPDGQTLLVAGEDGLRWLEAATGRPLSRPLHPEGGVVDVTFGPDGRTVLLRGKEWFQLWHRDTGRIGEPFRYRSADTPSRPFLEAFSRDGRLLLTSVNGKNGRVVQVRDTVTGQPLGQPLRHRTDIAAAAFRPDGGAVLTVDLNDKERAARLWEVPPVRPTDRPLPQNEAVAGAAFTADGRTVVTVERNGWRVWDVAGGQLLVSRAEPGVVAAGPDGRTVLVSDGKEARLRDARTGEPSGPPVPHGPGGCEAAVFGPYDTRLVTLGTSGKPARLWTLTEGHWAGVVLVLSRLQAGDPYAVAFSQDGKTLLAATGAGCRLWDTATGTPHGEPVRYEFKDAVQALVTYFDPKGKPVVGCAGRFRTWLGDGTTGKELRLVQHPGEGLQAVSPDGRVWLRAGMNGLVQPWDLAPEQPQSLGEPFKADGKVFAFSPDGTLLLTGDGNRAARLTLLPGPVPAEGEAVRLWLEVAVGISAAAGAAPGADAEPPVLDSVAWQQRRQRLAEQRVKE
jgi:WD40 repeat protein